MNIRWVMLFDGGFRSFFCLLNSLVCYFEDNRTKISIKKKQIEIVIY